MKIKPENLKDLLISEAAAVDEAARRAVRHALLTNKRAGHSISAWKDGEVVIIPPERIEVESGVEDQG